MKRRKHTLTTPMQVLHHERADGHWIVYIAYSPDFKYGTRLLLYDTGRRVLEVVRPDEVQIVELDDNG